MLKSLKNHPFAVEAFFESSTVLTFAVPKEKLEHLIPECLTLDTFEDKWAFLAVAMVQTKDLRPKGFPKFIGNDFFLIGYRLFVRYTNSKGKRLRGLYILKSETDSKIMEVMGNTFTHYNYTTTDISEIENFNSKIIRSEKSDFNIEIDNNRNDVLLPKGSPFSDWKQARRFAGPLPFTFTYNEDTKEVLVIEGVRSNWKPSPRKHRIMELKRRKFQGVLNILSFNRHFYIYGFIILSLILLSRFVIPWMVNLQWTVIIAFIYGFLAPLIVSAYVYDFSGYYDLDWLKKLSIKDSGDLKMVNINAGFDETSFLIKNQFPKSSLKVFDFYNQQKHTEPAIVRARKVSLVYPRTKTINTNKIPLEDKSIDVVYLLSTAHEIRSNKEKVEFLKECRRIIKPKGKVIMIEHLRDVPNFLAFSIGFTHFFSKSTWQKVFDESGFILETETKFTPFMSIFNFTIK